MFFTQNNILYKMSSTSLIKREPLLLALIIFFTLLLLVSPGSIYLSVTSFPLKTMVAIITMMIITNSIEESKYLSRFSRKILARISDERKLAVFVVLFSAFLASFLTNDIALFVMIPLTIELQRSIKNDVEKLVIFEAIAVNVGSALTPIGNPQNLYLWSREKISFFQFMGQMLIPVVISFAVLIAFIIASFPRNKIELKEKEEFAERTVLFWISLFVLVSFIISLQFSLEYLAFLSVIILYIFINRSTFKKLDFALIFIFFFIFVDFGAVPNLIPTVSAGSPRLTFVVSALLSQGISNVPASVVMANLSPNLKEIAWGVNVGGNGLLIASLANLIAVRLYGKKRKIMVDFHKYSIPFFLLTLLVVLFFI